MLWVLIKGTKCRLITSVLNWTNVDVSVVEFHQFSFQISQHLRRVFPRVALELWAEQSHFRALRFNHLMSSCEWAKQLTYVPARSQCLWWFSVPTSKQRRRNRRRLRRTCASSRRSPSRSVTCSTRWNRLQISVMQEHNNTIQMAEFQAIPIQAVFS